jgi:hypothetical protein
MIEETTLPKLTPAARDGGSYNSLKNAYPYTQIKINITRNKQMNVIGQNYIAAQCDPTSRCFPAVLDDCRMNCIVREQLPPTICAQRNEMQRLIEINRTSLRRFSFNLLNTSAAEDGGRYSCSTH